MKKEFLIYCLLLTLIINGCVQKVPNHKLINKFPKEFELKGEDVDDLDTVSGIMSIFTTEKYIVLGRHKYDYFYSVYSKSDMSFIMNLCYRGQGPNDFLSPIFLGQCTNNSFWILDRPKSVQSKIDIEKSINSGTTLCREKISLKEAAKVQIRDAFIVDSVNFLCAKDIDECSYYLINISDKSSTKISNEYELQIPKDFRHEILQKMTVYNTEKKKFASAYYSLPKVSFSSIYDGTFASILYSKSDVDLSEHNLEKLLNCNYFDAISSTNEYVYCLYNDQCLSSSSSSVFVFDWEGNPIVKYDLGKTFTHFYVDSHSQNIYAINYEKESNVLTIFHNPM